MLTGFLFLGNAIMVGVNIDSFTGVVIALNAFACGLFFPDIIRSLGSCE